MGDLEQQPQRAPGERPTFSEFIEPGLDSLRSFFDIGVTTDAPTPTADDPLGVFNTGLSIGGEEDVPILGEPNLDVGSFKTEEGRDAFGFDAGVGLVDAESEPLDTSLHHLLVSMGCDSLACQSNIPNWMSEVRIGGEVEAATAGATAMDDGETTELGAAATLGGAAVSLGNTENNLRFGLSEGPSLAGRVHRGDEDGDGRNEMGFGFDAGIFTFDLKSERLDMDWSNPFAIDPIWSDEDFLNGD